MHLGVGQHIGIGQPFSWIRKIERISVSRGHMVRLTLSCGHTVDRMLGRKYAQGMRVHCPQCR